MENKLEFQTWICPICCDDHTKNMEHHALCDIKDLVDMREQLNTAQKNEVDLHNVCAEQKARIKELEAQLEEQCDINMQGQERELKLIGQLEIAKEALKRITEDITINCERQASGMTCFDVAAEALSKLKGDAK